MATMDQFLAEQYGTNKTAAAASHQEDLEKEASVQLFMKLAGEQNIDLTSMPDTEVQALYTRWHEKVAAAEQGQETQAPKTASDDNDADEKKKREEAEKEHEEKKAAAEKVAEADFLGRVMAHAYVQELHKIASDASGETQAQGGEEEEHKEAAMPEALRKGLEAARGAAGKAGKGLEHVGKKVTEKATGVGAHGMKPSHAKGVGAAAVGAGAAAAGAAGAAIHHKKKQSSAIDELAAERAVYLANEGGFDPEEAGRKVAAVRELELLGESEKVASAPDVDTAIGIRALEMLERAGYPVTWNQQ